MAARLPALAAALLLVTATAAGLSIREELGFLAPETPAGEPPLRVHDFQQTHNHHVAGSAGWLATLGPYMSWILVGIMLVAALIGGGITGGVALLLGGSGSSQSQSATEKKLKRGIAKRQLQTLRDAIPAAKKEREAYEKDVRAAPKEGESKPSDPVPSLEEAEALIPELEAEEAARKKAEEEAAAAKKKAQEEAAEKKRLADEERAAAKKKAQEEAAEKKRLAEEERAAAKKKAEEEAAEKKRLAEEEKAAAKKKAEEEAAARKRAEEEAEAIMDKIVAAMNARDKHALHVALKEARGKPAVDRALVMKGCAVLSELRKEKRREAALKALKDAVAKPSIVALSGALSLARKAPCTDDEMREARELLATLEGEQHKALALARAALKADDLDLIEKIIKEHGGDLPKEELEALMAEAERLKVLKKKLDAARAELLKHLQEYKEGDLSPHQIAEAVDVAAEAGMGEKEMHALLADWDPTNQYHKILTNADHKIIQFTITNVIQEDQIKEFGKNFDIKKDLVTIMAPSHGIERKIIYDEVRKVYFAQVPSGHVNCMYGPERSTEKSAKEDLTAMCKAWDDTKDEDEKPRALRKMQIDLHLRADGEGDLAEDIDKMPDKEFST